MKKFLLFRNRIMLYISLIIFFSIIPYFISSIIAKSVNTYSIDFTYSNEVIVENITSKDYLVLTKNKIIDYRNSIIAEGKEAPYSDFSYVNINKLEKSIKIIENDEYLTISVSQNLFNSKAQAKRFLKTLIEDKNINNNSEITYFDKDIINSNEYIIPEKTLLISFLSSFFLITLIFVLLFFFKEEFYYNEIKYDNANLYRTPFHKSYWTSQFKWLKNTREMVLLSILFALMKVVGLISIPSGFANLGIGLTYLVFSIIGLLYGPLTSFFIGALSDIVGFFMGDAGTVFHIGYTLNAALSGFAYGLAFYRTNITFYKSFLSRLFVNLFVNVLLGSIWWAQVSNLNYDQMINYLLVTSLPKNLVYLIPQSLLLFSFIKFMIRPLASVNKITDIQANSVKIL